ncbi:hypothetical protein JCM3770_000409 [Rhodotorula araucariae]
MAPQTRAQPREDGTEDAMDFGAAVSTAEIPLTGEREDDGADEGFTPARVLNALAVGRSKASSSYFLPGRGLSSEVISPILQEDCLVNADYANCALVSRTFGALAHNELYAIA